MEIIALFGEIFKLVLRIFVRIKIFYTNILDMEIV